MEMLGSLDKLQAAASHRGMRHGLKWTATAPAVIGAIMIVVGLANGGFGKPAIVLGCVFVAAAVWTFAAAQPIALIVNGILLTLGGFGVTGWIIWDLTHGGEGGRGIIVGLGIGIWGLITMGRYKKFKLVIANLDPMAVARVDQLVDTLRKARVSDEPEAIKFVEKGETKETEWRARLFSDGILLIGSSNLILFLPKSGFSLERRKPVPVADAKPEKKIDLVVKIGAVTVGGGGWLSERVTIEPQYAQRYEAWKGVSLNALKMASTPIG